ncbi:MAG: M48 family metalloprotease [Salinirussus sp.]
MRRALATILTLGLLSTFLFAVILGIMLAFGVISLPVAAVLVVVLNLIILLVSPTINDFVYGWLYDLDWITLDELRERNPSGAAVIEQVTDEYGYKQPRLGLIPDRNPTAFAYGSGRFNGRVVVTEGIFEYLDDEEAASVLAHELGHITSRDFIIMTLANTIVQLLYLLAIYSWRIAAASGRGSSGSRGRAAGLLYGVAVLSYILWFVGEYAVLYLSRVREYAADAFAAEYTHPDALASALVTIAYGIVMSEDDPELEKATRNLGIVNIDRSKTEGIIYHNVRESGDSDLLLRSFLFDLKNPWAALLELNSTHPLTGKRVRRLSNMSGAERFNFDDIERRFEVDRGRLWRNFARDIGMLGLPVLLAVGFPLLYLGAVVTNVVAFSIFALAGGWLFFVGVAMVAQARYKYPGGDPEETSVIELLADVYASPVRGARARLEGELIGRGRAGYRFSEDLMFQDDTGLMYLKYDHWLPILGNFLFSVRQVPELIGESVEIHGWYLRGVSPWLGLRRLRTGDEEIKGFIHIGGYVAGGVLLAVGLVLLVLGL